MFFTIFVNFLKSFELTLVAIFLNVSTVYVKINHTK